MKTGHAFDFDRGADQTPGSAQGSRSIVVMGVSGAGKSDVGAALAERLGATFTDADSLHPQSNVEKMAAGIPLTDEDRWPWLSLVGKELASPHANGIIVACSALKRAYRDAIRATAPSATFILLNVELTVLRDRVATRAGHFMPPALLVSQLETLEPLQGDEPGLTLIPEEGIKATADQIIVRLAGQKPPRTRWLKSAFKQP